MAKRSARGARNRMTTLAEDLGSFLGGVANRVDSWTSQRDQLANQLRQIQNAAGDLIEKLGGKGISNPFRRGRRRRATASGASTAGGRGGRKLQGRRRGRRKFTPAQRRAASLRAKRMWAERRRQKAKP